MSLSVCLSLSLCNGSFLLSFAPSSRQHVQLYDFHKVISIRKIPSLQCTSLGYFAIGSQLHRVPLFRRSGTVVVFARLQDGHVRFGPAKA